VSLEMTAQKRFPVITGCARSSGAPGLKSLAFPTNSDSRTPRSKSGAFQSSALPEPLQERRVLCTLVLDHPSLVLSQPQPDPRRQELQRQRVFRRRNPPPSVLFAPSTVEIAPVKLGLVYRQAPSITHL
jgi:hypothetical protein